MRNRLFIISFVLAVVSCCKQETVPSDDGIALSFGTKATFYSPSEEIVSSCVLIADEAGYNAMATSGLASALKVCPISDLSLWAHNSYGTGVSYPKLGSAYIFAYAPSDRLNTEDNWKTLNCDYPSSGYDNSIWDGIFVAGPLSGTYDSPVTTPLEFRHPVARFRFSAFLDESMTQYKVRTVTLEADSSIVPYSLTWDASGGIWKARSKDGNTASFTFEDSNSVDILGHGNSNAILMEYYYFLPQNNSYLFGPFSLSATYYIEGDASSEKRQSKSNVFFEITDSTGNHVSGIQAGETYSIYIRFKQDSFTMYGTRNEDWNDGGNIIIPIINETSSFFDSLS